MVLEHGTWNVELGTWNMELGTWSVKLLFLGMFAD